MRKILYILFFLSASLHISDFSQQKKTFLWDDLDLTNIIRMELGTTPLYAASDSWGFVRGSATWARGNSNLLDQVIAGIKNQGLLNTTGTFSSPVTVSGMGSVTLRLKLKIDSAAITSTAYNGTKIFSNTFEIIKSGSSIPSLQLFFDSAETLEGNDGALMYYKLSEIDPVKFGSAPNAMVESYSFVKSGIKKQTYTWAGGPKNNSWPSDNGRVTLDEITSLGQLCFRSVVRMDLDALIAINPASATSINNLKTVCGGSIVYYNLAYMQNFAAPFYTTAKMGVTSNAQAGNDTICNFAGSSLTYGLFDENGFVSDKTSVGNVPSGYPSPNLGTWNVDSAFLRTGTGYTSEAHDNTSASYIDSLSTTEAAKLNFK
ncbi:LIC_12337 family protein [Leptospira sp. 'Mane']|uniref:LIC_12337 family protein n=1 Tax=Leptospira sp. 'Mane' TaxID=3387407 RepID=UPI00398AAD72